MSVLTHEDTIIPEFVYVGHVKDHPWTFVYYDKDKIEEELEAQVVKNLGYSGLYWDEDDTGAILFSHEQDQELTEEELESGDWDELAYYSVLEIEDAWEYAYELKKDGVIK